MRTVDYIEMRAKTLVSELSQAWSIEKRRELREVLNDLEDVENAFLADEVVNEQLADLLDMTAAAADPKPKRTRRSFPRKPRNWRKPYFDSVLDYIQKRKESDLLEGDLYAEDFGLDFKYFSEKFCFYLNKEIKKRQQFDGYRIGFSTYPNRMHYLLMRTGETNHANA